MGIPFCDYVRMRIGMGKKMKVALPGKEENDFLSVVWMVNHRKRRGCII